jgi:hypothetical protein
MSIIYRERPITPANYTRQETYKCGVCWHHAATTSLDGVFNTFNTPGRNASTHYGIVAGRADRYVDDAFITWHAGDWWANSNLISVEVVNSAGAPGWPISEDTLSTLVEWTLERFYARPEWGVPELGRNIYYHSMFAATACPGVIKERADELVARINAALVPVPVPATYGKVQLFSYHGGDNQLFYIEQAGEYVRLVSKASGGVLDAEGSATADGTSVLWFRKTGALNQLWRLVHKDYDAYSGFYTIATALDGTKVLDAWGAETGNMTQVKLFHYTGANNQLWQLVPIAENTYYLLNVNSGKVLDCNMAGM